MGQTAKGSGRHGWWLALLVVSGLLAVGLAIAWRAPIAPVPAPAVASFAPGLVQQGRVLAAIGNCITCHTSNPLAPYAGGVAIGTPFGAIHSTNITPDPATGIGTWSEPALRRAMREGVSRDGHHLYPAFPYDHYTHVSDDDVHALYAFLMTRTPLDAAPVANHLHFPFNLRPLVAGWNLLYLDRRPLATDPAQSAQWNRGAYLAQALGHCSACHSPRNALGAEDRRRYLSGGQAEDWYAPALNAESPSPVPWTAAQLSAYLRTGLVEGHAMAGGPMQGVVEDLQPVPAAEVDAMALYIQSVMGEPTPARLARSNAAQQRAGAAAPVAAGPLAADSRDQTPAQGPARSSATIPPHAAPQAPNPAQPQAPNPAQPQASNPAQPQASNPAPHQAQPEASASARVLIGAQLYRETCARCHDAGRQASSGGALQLPLAVALYEPDPRSLIHLVRDGIQPASNQGGRWMPGFADVLSDEQLVALLGYLRHDAAASPPWTHLDAAVAKARR